MRSSRLLYACLAFVAVAAGLGLLAVAAEGSEPDLGDEVVVPAGGSSPTQRAEPTTPTAPPTAVPTTGARPTGTPTATTPSPTGPTTGAVPVRPRPVPTAGDDDADDVGEPDDGAEAHDE